MTSSTTTRARLLVAAGLAALLLAGCSGGSDSDATSAGGGGEAAAPPAQDGSGGGAGSGDAGSGGDQDGAAGGEAGSTVTVPERKITRSQVTVEVDDLSRSAQQVRDLAAANGGEVTDESLGLSQSYEITSGSYDGGAGEDVDLPPSVVASPGEARLVLRVPPDAAQETVDEIAALGTETGRWSSSTSVETTLVDLESRIASQTAAVQQAQELMDRATSLQDIVLLENEVNSRTEELESLKARQASIQGQAEQATVTAVLQTRERTEEVAAGAGFLGGLRAGWDALQASVGVLLTVVGALLPFAVVALLVGYPVYRLVRRRRATRPPVSVLAPAGPPAGWDVRPPAPPVPPVPSAGPRPPATPGAGDEKG